MKDLSEDILGIWREKKIQGGEEEFCEERKRYGAERRSLTLFSQCIRGDDIFLRS